MNYSLSNDSEIGWRLENTYALLPQILSTKVLPTPVKLPELLFLNKPLSDELGLNFDGVNNDFIASIFSGNKTLEGSLTLAQAYAGHQFGYFTMLGDGRALLLGEHITSDNKRFDIQLKGSGKTPYSRGGDGRAALGPILREYIISEAMFYMGIPTTRGLAVVKTGENVLRDYPLPGAILTRVASSHIRIGTFQYAAMQNNKMLLSELTKYTIKRHFPEILDNKNSALFLLKAVIKKQIDLVVDWMRVGFIHGVMNTDNITVSGETIDYGPCAFMDVYYPKTVFSSIDHGGRYSFINQPTNIHWGLSRFAEALLPLMEGDKKKVVDSVRGVIDEIPSLYEEAWFSMMRKKLGFFDKKEGDKKIILELLKWMEQRGADYTNTFLFLSNDLVVQGGFFYKDKTFLSWKSGWNKRLEKNKFEKEKSFNLMRDNNPLIIPRNFRVEGALKSASENNDFEGFKNLIKFLKKPNTLEKNTLGEYQKTPPDNGRGYKTFCGT